MHHLLCTLKTEQTGTVLAHLSEGLITPWVQAWIVKLQTVVLKHTQPAAQKCFYVTYSFAVLQCRKVAAEDFVKSISKCGTFNSNELHQQFSLNAASRQLETWQQKERQSKTTFQLLALNSTKLRSASSVSIVAALLSVLWLFLSGW